MGIKMNVFEEFNLNQRRAVKKICEELGSSISNTSFHVGFWNDSNNFEVSDFGKESHNWLNYYWAEYTKDNDQYRLTMFFKDFDHGSGNIHVSPGGIQIWKKINSCISLENGKSYILE